MKQLSSIVNIADNMVGRCEKSIEQEGFVYDEEQIG